QPGDVAAGRHLERRARGQLMERDPEGCVHAIQGLRRPCQGGVAPGRRRPFPTGPCAAESASDAALRAGNARSDRMPPMEPLPRVGTRPAVFLLHAPPPEKRPMSYKTTPRTELLVKDLRG